MSDTQTLKVVVELTVPLGINPLAVADELLDVLCEDDEERLWQSVDGTEPVAS